MSINGDRSLLEQQILSNSGLQGSDLEALKVRLAALSEQELQAKLSESLSGQNIEEWCRGLMLEHNDSVVLKNNYDENTYTDEEGNEVTEVKNGDEVFERIIKTTDSNGNVYQTIVSFSGGRPLTQTKTKNGNTIETTTYKYNDDAEVPFVTVETKKSDRSVVTTNVLEIDENGNFDIEDFIDRKTISIDGTTTHIYTVNNCVIEEQIKPNGKKVDTVYKGDSVDDYDNKKLHRVYQRTELKGEVHEVAYDGDGNTRTVVQNGESPSVIAQKFGVKESSLLKLNPAKGKNAITQVGADILVPGEYDADSRVMTRRKSKQGAIQDYADDEVQRTAERLYSSTMQEVTLDKDYKDAYSYARALLVAGGVKNPSNQQVNDKANEILVANGNISFKKGTKVQISANRPDSKYVKDLSNSGFKPTRENAIFYNKFNALNPQQQENVMSVIKYCRSQKITDSNQIKAKILETFPDINLFDSGKLIPMNSSFGTSVFQRKNPVALETFLVETLKLDLQSEVGRQVYERLASLPQEELDKINAQNFGDLSKANFVEIAHQLEVNGVDIRTRQEHQIENNSPRMKAEQEKRETREAAAQNIALAYDNAINLIKQYQDNQGWMNVGFYREKLGSLLSKINPTDVNTCFDDVIKELEKEKKFAVGYLKGKSTNDKEFREAFKKISGGVEYSEKNMKAFLEVAQEEGADFNDEKYNEKFWNAYNKAFGIAKTDKNGKVYYESQVVKEATSRVDFQQYVDGAGDIVLMLLGTEAIGKGLSWAGGKVLSRVSPYVPKFLSNAASKTVMTIGSNNVTVGRVVGNMAQQSATFTLWDASKNYINLKTKDIQYSGEAAEQEWDAYKEGNIESAKFGAFAGVLNTTVVGKVINGTMKMFEKPIAKAVAKVGKSFEKTSVMTGADVMKTFMMNQTPGVLAHTAGTLAEIAGFTLYETANEIAGELLKTDENGERHFPAELTEDGLSSYLWERLKGQATNLGEIKAISRLMFMHKGAIKEQARLMDENLAKCETLKNVKIKKTEVNGREIFEVTMPDGNRKVAHSVEEVIANCNVLMQMDMISNSLKDKESIEWRKLNIGGEEVEVAVTKNADGTESVDYSKARRKNANGEYEHFAPTTERDLLKNEGAESLPHEELKEYSQEDIIAMKKAGEQISVMPDGTVLKTNPSSFKTTIIGKLVKMAKKTFNITGSTIGKINFKSKLSTDFTESERKVVLDLYDKDPYLAELLLNDTVFDASKGEDVQRFSKQEILQLAKLDQTNSSILIDLLNVEYKTSNGTEKLYAYEIETKINDYNTLKKTYKNISPETIQNLILNTRTSIENESADISDIFDMVQTADDGVVLKRLSELMRNQDLGLDLYDINLMMSHMISRYDKMSASDYTELIDVLTSSDFMPDMKIDLNARNIRTLFTEVDSKKEKDVLVILKNAISNSRFYTMIDFDDIRGIMYNAVKTEADIDVFRKYIEGQSKDARLTEILSSFASANNNLGCAILRNGFDRGCSIDELNDVIKNTEKLRTSGTYTNAADYLNSTEDSPIRDIVLNTIFSRGSYIEIVFAGNLTEEILAEDTPVNNYIRDHKRVSYDMPELDKIKTNSELENRVFSFLLEINTDKRFEALAIKNIIESVKTEADFLRLKELVSNKDITTFDIIKELKTESKNQPSADVELKPEADNVEFKSVIKKLKNSGKIEDDKLAEYKERLKELYTESPRRFKKIVDSGLFDLIEAGKIDSSILKNLDYNTFLSNRTLKDIRKIRDGKQSVETLDSSVKPEEIGLHVENGEVCEINGKLYLNENGNPVEIKMTKEMYNRLFPPLSTVSFEQVGLGNCWNVTALDNCMDLSWGKAGILRLFEQKGNDVYITFPGSDKKVCFKNGEVLDAKSKQIQSTNRNFDDAPMGILMVEQAYAVHRFDNAQSVYADGTDVTDISTFTDVPALMERLRGGWQYEAIKDIFGKDITFDSYGVSLENREKMIDLIIKTANDKNVMTFFTTRRNSGSHDNAIAKQYDLYDCHAYSIKGYDINTGMVYITNPWHTSVITEVPIYELIKYIDDVNIASKANL